MKRWSVKVFFIFAFLSFKLNFAFADMPAIHGMLMFGHQTIYLSHLPMFHSPHDYQVILQVSLASQAGNPQAIYVNDRLRTHERIYTLVPDQAFVLPEVVQKKLSFSATLFRGHFERGGIPIFKGAIVNIEKIIYFHKFNPSDQHLKTLEYLMFGEGTELFLAHVIVACPDFDQVLAIATAHPVPANVLAAPISFIFPGRSNTNPLKENEITSAKMGSGLGIETIRVLGQYYFETHDLVCMNH